MARRDTTGRRLRVGELAEATGLTVRTIHHYEHVGLLAAPKRSDGNQRLYDEDYMRRLYRVRALRDRGFALSDVAEILDEGDERGAALGELLRARLARVDAVLARLQRLRLLLERACVQADRRDEPVDVLRAIEAMARVSRRVEERAASTDASTDASANEARWRAIGRELRACMEAGEPPSSARARDAARPALSAIRAFAGDDRATLDALATLRRLDPPDDLAGWDPPLMQYLDRALDALAKEDEAC